MIEHGTELTFHDALSVRSFIYVALGKWEQVTSCILDNIFIIFESFLSLSEFTHG
jgi:hypothetical protein